FFTLASRHVTGEVVGLQSRSLLYGSGGQTSDSEAIERFQISPDMKTASMSSPIIERLSRTVQIFSIHGLLGVIGRRYFAFAACSLFIPGEHRRTQKY